jgi:hypothetical protein
MSLTPQFGTIVPSQKQELLNSNYLKFNDGAAAGDTDTFAQQYLPEIYEQEVERYGNRTLSGFLRMVGAEMPMSSDQVIWSEQNRLHISYDGCSLPSNLTININPGAAADVFNVVSPRATIVVLDPATGLEEKCLVTDSNTTTGVLTVQPYTVANLAAFTATGLKVFVYGSEYQKGGSISAGAVGANTGTQYVSVDPQFTQHSNSPIIIKSQYVVSGSDMAQIGWVEVATEDGASGYLWYLKAESETRLRFEDYLEMAMIEGEKVGAASAITTGKGTEGLFAAIEGRGNVNVGFTAAAGLDAFDDILKNLDTQGAIEENMLFLQRQTALDFDDMLAAISGGSAGGTAFGLFENSEEMALNLGFSGFRRGSYDFYKTDWKYLNDASTRGAIDGVNSIEGVLVPAGTSTVYDQVLGTNIRRPFLHVRYRASQGDDRRMKSWLTGSAGGAFTSTLDAMEVNFLSERCLVTQAANNFVLFKGI